MTRRGAVPALAGAALLAAAGTAIAAIPRPGTYDGTTGQGLDARVKVNSSHRVKRFRIHWWATCDRPGATWGSKDDPGGTVIRDLKKYPIEQDGTGAFSDKAKYEDVQNNAGYQDVFRVSVNGTFTDRTHANGSFTVRIRVTKDGKTYDHCRRTVRWRVSPAPAAPS